jgi:hypothetical protein
LDSESPRFGLVPRLTSHNDRFQASPKPCRKPVMGREQKPLLPRPSGWFRFNERTFTRGAAEVSNAPKAAFFVCPLTASNLSH